ncbi:Peptide-methionine (S)-S-oxide reductase MsrA [hydrothermal vent metagenome]|uniref:peptide-methionine (S)-S-oxide reductase n=1 Tax=hydrothermal vent metagenome TaxID=652676 RepID=A0A3B0XUB0_9ZZZZ
MLSFKTLLFLFLTAVLILSFNTSRAGKTANIKSIVLAGGCFWCIEADYEKLNGIVDVVSGYSGGHTKNPTYKKVSAGRSGHLEVVKVTYNPNVISYTEILDYFWRHIDPTRNDGQFCDKGIQYRPAIFYKNDKEKQAILKSAKQINKIKTFSEPLKVEYIQASTFYPAEEYHQDYYKKNPLRYKYYRFACNRDQRVESLWNDS